MVRQKLPHAESEQHFHRHLRSTTSTQANPCTNSHPVPASRISLASHHASPPQPDRISASTLLGPNTSQSKTQFVTPPSAHHFPILSCKRVSHVPPNPSSSYPTPVPILITPAGVWPPWSHNPYRGPLLGKGLTAIVHLRDLQRRGSQLGRLPRCVEGTRLVGSSRWER